jgi:hypothetical protein
LKPTLKHWHDGGVEWRGLFELLAWERAEPALHELGLGHLDLAGLREIAQAYLVASSARVFDEAMTGEELLQREQRLLDDALARIEADLGPPALARILTFASSMTYSERGPAYYVWAYGTFPFWERPFVAETPIPPLSDDAFDALLSVIREWQTDIRRRLQDLEDGVRGTPPTPQEVDTSLKVPSGMRSAGRPITLSLLHHALHLEQARRLWAGIRQALSPDELDTLVAWLNEQDRAMAIELGFPPERPRGLDDLA